MFPQVRDPDLDGCGLDALDRRIVSALSCCPLASVGDLAVWLDTTTTRALRRLRELEKHGIVFSRMFYLGVRPHLRWWLASQPFADVLPQRLRLHPPHQIVGLLRNLDFVAAVYQVCRDIVEQGGGQMVDFCWTVEAPFEAAARFDDGWVAFYWSGIWQTGNRTARRLTRTTQFLPAADTGDGHDWPARLCFIVPDHWQARVVSEAVSSVGLEDRLYVRVLADGASFGALTPVRSAGWYPVPAALTWPRPLDVTAATSRSLYAAPTGRTDLLSLALVEQWPGQLPSTLSRLAGGCHPSRLGSSLARMSEVRAARYLPDGSYSPTDRWLRRAALRDRVPARSVEARSGERYVDEWVVGRRRLHERGLAQLMGRFSAAGCPVAVGWRGREDHGKAGTVDPDGLVFLRQSPYGAGWFYVEYERRAVYGRSVAHKLRFLNQVEYAPRFPVLVVCRPEALRTFVEFAHGRPALVATTRDAKNGAVTGTDGTVWIHNGEPTAAIC